MSGTNPPPASNIVGTVTMYIDQQYLVPLGFTVPSGGKLVDATEAVDDSTIVSVIPGALGAAGGGFNAIENITVQGLGKVGTTTVHFLANGEDQQDLVFNLVARPNETLSLQTAAGFVQDTPAPAAATTSPSAPASLGAGTVQDTPPAAPAPAPAA